ncbi:MAG: DUF1653 domain-containing protein [Bacteroidales bacterium]|nr:DUF1653 domain-containing protein [Bacteroidales bacterium]
MKYYRHYKGNYYRVLSEAKHSETLEEMVVYQAMYGEQAIWVRPKGMFYEQVKLADGKTTLRFAPCSEDEAMASLREKDDDGSLSALIDELYTEFKEKGYAAEDFMGGCSLCGEVNEFAQDLIFSKVTKTLANLNDTEVDKISKRIYAEIHKRLEADEQ